MGRYYLKVSLMHIGFLKLKQSVLHAELNHDLKDKETVLEKT